MHEIERKVLISIPPVLGIDLSITNEVVLLWSAAAISFVLLAAAFRRKNPVPRGPFQNLFEALMDMVERAAVKEGIGEGWRQWSTFLLTLFFFILFSNLLGMAPFPSHVKSATASLSVPAGLALIVFAVTIAIRIVKHGFMGFLKQFAPPGLPAWVQVMVVPIEVVSWLAKPVSLTVRLFANMMVGHGLIMLFVGLAAAAAWYLKPLPFAGAVVMSAFEVFVSFIQAFIFTMLAGFYVREALEEHG